MNFNIQTFYKMGMVCFIVIALGNSYSMIHAWQILDIGAKVSRIAGVGFNFLLVYFFYWMLKSNKASETQQIKTDEEILGALDLK